MKILYRKKAALLIIDMWNTHWCEQAVNSGNEIAPKINDLAKIFRKKKQIVIHAPSGVTMTRAYENYPQWLSVENVIEKFSSRIKQVDEIKDIPIYSGIGSCPDNTVMIPVWTKIHDKIRIAKTDKISNDARQIFTYLYNNANIIYVCGLHLNMCVMKNSYGVINLVKAGFNIEIIEDLTDVMYNPARHPQVSLPAAKKLMLEYIESKYCRITNSRKLTRYYGII